MKKRIAMMLGTVAVLGLGALGGSAEGQDEGASIKKVMGKLHGKGKGLLPAVKKQLESGSPSWPDVKKEAKDIVLLSKTILQAEPPRGEKESYSKLQQAYVDTAGELSEAAEAEDLDKGKAALKKLGGTCKACHQAHQLQR